MRRERNRDEIGLITERVCPICGKQFIIHDLQDYTYKMTLNKKDIQYYCSWTCYRKAEKERESKGLRWRRVL